MHVGLVTPVGLSALATAMAVRAGVARFQSSDFFDDYGEPIPLAVVPPGRWSEEPFELVGSLELDDDAAEVDEVTDLAARIELLGGEALRQCLDAAVEGPARPIFWIAAEPQDTAAAHTPERRLDRLARRFGAAIDRPRSRCFTDGRAGGAAAIQAALGLLDESAAQEILLVGVDSYHDSERLARLGAEGRLPGAEARDAIALGEAAACLLLSRNPDGALATIRGCGVASEPGHRYSDEPCLGNGLTESIRTALRGCAGAPIRTVYGTLNGESRQAKEWGIAYIRNQRAFAADCELLHPADCIGDVGAASLPLLVGLAAIAAQRGHRPQPTLIWGASEYAGRGAVVIS